MVVSATAATAATATQSSDPQYLDQMSLATEATVDSIQPLQASGEVQAALLTCGLLLDGRWMLVSVSEPSEKDVLCIHGFDPIEFSRLTVAASALDWESPLGFGALTTLSGDDKVELSKRLCECLRLRDGALVVDMESSYKSAEVAQATADVVNEATATVEEPVVSTGVDPGSTSLVLCGAKVDGKHLLLWFVAHGEGQLKVHGFDPQTCRRVRELVIGSEDWARIGFGPLEELSPAATRDLCNRACGMLRLDDDETGLLLLPLPVAPSVEDAVEAEPQTTLLYSCASRVSGRLLLVSFWSEPGAADLVSVLVQQVAA